MNASKILALALVTLFAASCQKTISLDVNNAASQVVIEALVTDTLQPWSVRLSNSVRYDSTNNTPPITGASVVVVDATAGTRDTLSEVSPGMYKSAAKAGLPGHRYELTVRTGNSVFTSTSVMPQRVSFDSLYAQVQSSFGGTFRLLFPVFTDPAGVPNYYRFIIYRNGQRMNFDTRDDRFSDGRINGRPVGPDDQDSIKVGDILTVEMQCIDKGVYDYFESFRQADGGGSAPANPISNIQGGALGYFGAVSTQKRSVPAP
jgi:hypothetical protein